MMPHTTPATDETTMDSMLLASRQGHDLVEVGLAERGYLGATV